MSAPAPEHDHQAPAIADVGAHLAIQAELAERALHDLIARYVAAPATAWLTFGEGEAAEQTLPGAPRDPFHGFAILNGTAKTIRWGLASSAGIGSAFTVPPLTTIVMPAQFADLSLAVSAADALGPLERVGVVRLQAPPPAPAVYQYGAQLELFNPLTGNAEAQRTPTVFTAFPAAGHAAPAATEEPFWTPAAGKRFRLLGWTLEVAVATQLELLDGAAGTRVYTIPLAAGVPNVSPILGNGILSRKVGNALVAVSSVGGNVRGTLYGVEE